jgi:predicted TIM-barrel fold metal-dependent hydrolase
MWDHKEELELFFSLGLSEEQNRMILYDNFAKAYGL